MATMQVETQVKNTFIDMPSTPSGFSPLPSPMATAPAKTCSAWSLKESLIHAAADEPQEQAVGPAIAVVQRRLKNRAGPQPLNFVSTSSMMSIPESPSAYGYGKQLTVRKEPVRYMSTSSSIPPTPAALCEISSTPTGTPANFVSLGGMYTSMPVPEMGTAPSFMGPAPAPRTTLSLVDMIQSPKAEAKVGMLQSAFQQYYTAAPQPASAAAPPTVTLPPQAAMPVAAPSGAPKVMSAAPMPPPPLYQPNVIAPATPTAAPAGIALGFPSVAQAPTIEPNAPSPSAAVALGLVTQASPAPVAPAPLAVGTLPVQYAAPPAAMPPPATMPPPAAMPAATMPSAAVMMGAPAAMPQVCTLRSPQVTYMQTQPALQTPAVMSMPSMPPPPPMAPAPMVTSPQLAPPMYSPQANSTPVTVPVNVLSSAEADMKVLIDMALASGNQKAIDALQRQALQSGMSQEQFNALLKPGSPTTVMSTSPVSR